MRYCASTWSGDNYTSWAGMRGANALSLGAGMCLLQCYGHDIGGFEGPQPSPELLLRWIQLGCHSQRFAINCFKTSEEDNKVGDVIEPWMYPDITPLIRRAIKRRYEMIPYLYSLHLESHLFASPPPRWIGWGYENDPEVWTEALKSGETQYWLGDSLLVGGVYELGADAARMYLPKSSPDDPGYLNLNEPWQYHAAGYWAEIFSPWKGSIPLLAKVGSVIPIGKSVQTLAAGEKSNPAGLPADDYRAVELYPPPTGHACAGCAFTTCWYEDDGISARPKISKFTMTYSCCSNGEITLDYEEDLTTGFVPSWSMLSVILPVHFRQEIVLGTSMGGHLAYIGQNEHSRKTYSLAIPRGK